MNNDILVRKAENKDIERILELLTEVNHVHAEKRPDLFIDGRRKYEKEDLKEILSDPSRPVFVAALKDNDLVIGYAMTEITKSNGKRSLTKRTDLYIDDICVDENSRRMGVGEKLFGYVKEYAKKIGCHSVTLHVWECNPGARVFYEKMGMKPYLTAMETILD